VPNSRLYAVGMPGAVDLCIYSLVVEANPSDPGSPYGPGNPKLLVCQDLDAISPGSSNSLYIHDIFVKNSIAYCGHGYSGYYIWDVSDPAAITELGSLPSSFFNGGYVHSSWNSDDDNHAIVATELLSDPKLYWIDQSNPNLIQILDTYKEPLCTDAGNLRNKRPHNPYIIGDKIYTSLYHDGLHVLEIDFEADTIGRVGYYDTYPDNTNYNVGFQGNWGAYPYLPSGTILASDITYGLFTLKYDGPPTYSFLGPGTDWNTTTNWYNGEIPPTSFTGSVIISSSCVKPDADSFPANAKVVVNTGASLTQN